MRLFMYLLSQVQLLCKYTKTTKMKMRGTGKADVPLANFSGFPTEFLLLVSCINEIRLLWVGIYTLEDGAEDPVGGILW